MKLSTDFSGLRNLVEELNCAHRTYTPDFFLARRTKGIADILAPFEQLSEGLKLGEDIPLEQIQSRSGVFDFMGQQVIVYMPNQAEKINEVLDEPKSGSCFHLAECKVIEEKRMKTSLADHFIINRVDGVFPVYGIDPVTKKKVKGSSALHVCRYCLEILNYKGYFYLPFSKKKAITEPFDFEAFFENYTSHFKPVLWAKEKSESAPNDDLVRKIKEELDYGCEECGVNLKESSSLLQLYHINGLLSDNRRANIKLLCEDCNKKQLHVGYSYVKRRSILEINRRRREQNKFESVNYQKLEKSADSALFGLISKCRKHNIALPELGLSLLHENKNIDIDLAWTRKKVAILIDLSEQNVFEEAGWLVYSPHQALTQFDVFQKKVR